MDRMTITFGEYDKDVFEFLKNQKNASALIRHLVRNYMVGSDKPYNENDISINTSSNNKDGKIEVLEDVVNLLVKSIVKQSDNQHGDKNVGNITLANIIEESEQEKETSEPIIEAKTQDVQGEDSNNIEAIKELNIKL